MIENLGMVPGTYPIQSRKLNLVENPGSKHALTSVSLAVLINQKLIRTMRNAAVQIRKLQALRYMSETGARSGLGVMA